MMTLYDFKVQDALGNEVLLSEYRNQILLIVNTATKCGFTKQYQGLQQLYEKYHQKGFEILDFPCNQFLHQAPGTEEEIHDFCLINFGVKFRLFKKINVNGKNESPLYTFLKGASPENTGSRIKWNFTKFLIDRNGNVLHRFEPQDTPESIEPYIKELIS